MKAGQAAARVTTVELNDVAQARQSTGLSQAQFAEALCISKRTLQEWSKGAARHQVLRKRLYVLPSVILKSCLKRSANVSLTAAGVRLQ
jgi:putative transcriptional regulator